MIRFDDKGLVPAIVQDALSGAVLMTAFMNAEAFRLTLETGLAHFYSRSRSRLWKKGEESGHVLHVREVRIDCDEDAVLVRAEPAGPTCHTGRPSCFFRLSDGEEIAWVAQTNSDVLERLYEVILTRRGEVGRRSYVRQLFEGGPAAIAQKISEEAQELSLAVTKEPDDRVVAEAADVFFHVLVALSARDVEPRRVWAELERRFGVSGLDEKASRKS